MITVCITSFNRFWLLEQTLDSFLKLNKYPIKRWIINEDSGNNECYDKIKTKYGDLFDIIGFSNKIGQMKSIDWMYNLVDTKYIVHLEDDWKFNRNPDFIQQSVEILENNPNIHRVAWQQQIPLEWCNVKKEGDWDMMKEAFCGDWCGFSFTPGLIRLEDYKKMFPEGYGKYHEEGIRLDILENRCNGIAKNQGFRAAILKQRPCFSTGGNYSTYKHIK